MLGEGRILREPQGKFQPGHVAVMVPGRRDSPLLVPSDCQGTGLLSPYTAERMGAVPAGRAPPQIQPPSTHTPAFVWELSESISGL